MTIYTEETRLVESIQRVTSHHYWQKTLDKNPTPGPNTRAVHFEVFIDGKQLRQVNAPSFVLHIWLNEGDRTQTALNKKFNGNEDNGHNDGVCLSATMMACLIVVKLATIGAKK